MAPKTAEPERYAQLAVFSENDRFELTPTVDIEPFRFRSHLTSALGLSGGSGQRASKLSAADESVRWTAPYVPRFVTVMVTIGAANKASSIERAAREGGGRAAGGPARGWQRR